MLNKEKLRHLIPHDGTMLLIDKVLSFDAENLVACTQTHLDLKNPLLKEGRLRAVCGIEYGAQAIALHRSLADKKEQKEGYLISVRGIKLYVEEINNVEKDLQITVKSVLKGSDNSIYHFAIRTENQLLIEGNATVLIKKTVDLSDTY
ncbi:MAG: hypothetical protein ACTSXQ_02860 [Alphaproteobacteria bacterium]